MFRIADFFKNFFSSLLEKVLWNINGYLPDPPEQLAQACSGLSNIAKFVSPVAYFLPFPQLAVALGIVVYFWFAAFLIRLIRIVLSFMSFGGGS